MSFRLRQHNTVPPKGYTYKDRDTGFVITGNSYDQWMGRIVDHRKGNELPPVDALEVEDQLCSKLGAACSQFCESTDPKDRAVNGVTLHSSDIVRGTKTILAFKLAGSPLVSQDEANRRSAICATCPMNVPFISPCGGVCGELLNMVDSLVGGAKTTHADSLKACCSCSCALSAKVWIPRKFLDKYDTDEIRESYADGCWMLE